MHIAGDSGTGKELVARLIHDTGPRHDGPFVPVNCGAIPSELMESELFGHKKGSFTGAVADKEGLIRSAEGGTLFLDEVADLPLHMQVKLLRVIQEKSVRPVGETREMPVDVRMLSATHRKLDELVKSGKFREDLYYRINVIELQVPALRERLDDVPPLVDMLLDRIAGQIGVTRPQISDEAMDKLLSYSYPGNVRELENILERAVTLCSNDRIEPEDIQLKPGQLLTDLPEMAGRDVTVGEAGADGLEGPAGAHPARGHRPCARTDPLQQDQGGGTAGDDVPAAQVSREEAGDRVVAACGRRIVIDRGRGFGPHRVVNCLVTRPDHDGIVQLVPKVAVEANPTTDSPERRSWWDDRQAPRHCLTCDRSTGIRADPAPLEVQPVPAWHQVQRAP